MEPGATVRLRLLRGGTSSGRPRDGSTRQFRAWLGIAVAAAIAIVALALTLGRRSVRSIPDERRAAIYSRALADVKESCAGPQQPGALKSHCRELASFLAQFDECRGECEHIVRRQLSVNSTR